MNNEKRQNSGGVNFGGDNYGQVISGDNATGYMNSTHSEVTINLNKGLTKLQNEVNDSDLPAEEKDGLLNDIRSLKRDLNSGQAKENEGKFRQFSDRLDQYRGMLASSQLVISLIDLFFK
ncbi:hypothetical protein [Thermoflavimicrobium dichotomicum]|uniref:Uncharacterized protein n=1 Tax=Thermoflavimicrobium dichotomicum TaxID=46223 RepID=A0A1I3JP26_9BACL|nr:hypothetical protein [Thermoflavimicrobium dichotomicum]SFI61655.1 hypothetical protein SAMN05421852_101136 [Thermoflavimicrobium dichotomicum]